MSTGPIAMDVVGLRTCIGSTVDPHADTRRQAELSLKNAEAQPGFTNALLDILQSEQDNGIRLSTAVYLKNRVSRGWAPVEDIPMHKPIPPQDKDDFRNRLLPILASSTPQVRAQLLPSLEKILRHDFPAQWPNFVDVAQQLLGTADAASVLSGLHCFLALSRTYRLKGNSSREEYDQVVQASFPRLLSIGSRLVDENSPEAWEMLHTIFKTFKHAIYYELPPHLLAQDNIVAWCTLFLNIVAKDSPRELLPEDPEERARSHWWKSKKWAYANLNRLFTRYGQPGSMPKNSSAEAIQFAKTFITNFAPEILKIYLREVEKWAQELAWISKPALSHTLCFFDECVKPKSMWNHLKPHIDTLISYVLFPILCQSDEDIELFDVDPGEYLHRKLNFNEEVSAPDVAATNFLVSLTKSRKKQTYAVLSFVDGVVKKYESAPDDLKNPREKEGALRMIGTLASVILEKQSPIANQVEYFFVRHVFPEFRSPHGFLRARACDTLGKFDQLEFKDTSNLGTIYRHILESMADPDLPVRVEAALALQPLIRHEMIRTSMQQNIPQIMQQLLKLANEVDVDALANVMEDFVEEFAKELTPFAVALSEQLRDTFLRIVRELMERNSTKDVDEGYGEYLDDKSITALGVLQTIGTLILSLEASPDVLLHLETVLLPVITTSLENKLFDLYTEVFEIIDSCTFSAKAISPTMWQAFELMHKAFKAGGELYLEDMLPALDNFVTFGTDVFVQTPIYVDAIISMVDDMFSDPKNGGVDRICGCKLAETAMLNLRGHIDQHIPKLVALAMGVIANNEPKIKSYRIHVMEIIINAIYYNSRLTLHILEGNGWTNKFFSNWFSSIDMLSRVHDKKLSIVAISSLLTLQAEEVPVSVQQGWPRLLQGSVKLFQTLPIAMKNRAEAEKEDVYTVGNDDDDEEHLSEENLEEADWTNDNDEADSDVKDESAAYLEFLQEEAQKYGVDEGDDDLEESSLLASVLDDVEPYNVFKASFMKMRESQPQLYENLTKILNPDEQNTIQNVVMQADAIEAQAAATAAQASAPAQLNGNTQS